MSANNLQTLDGLFKTVYSQDGIENLIPEGLKVLPRIDFSEADSLGRNFVQPVILGQEHGVTFGATGDDALQLNDAIPGQVKPAEVAGTQMILRSQIGYKSVSSAVKSKGAFESATKFLVANMLRSMTKKLEIMILYGQVGYGVVKTAPTTTTITIEDGEWAPGIWAGSEKMPIEVRDATGATVRGTAKISKVNFETKTLTIDTAISGMVATDVIHHGGAYSKEFAGIHKILTNTGTIFGINSGDYSLFKGNVYDNGAKALSFTKLQKAVVSAVAKGLDDEVMVLVSAAAWADLMNDQAAVRMEDSSYSENKARLGSKSIEFFGQSGKMEVVPSIYVKEAYAYILYLKDFSRIGSSDLTFQPPGRNKGDVFFDMPNHSAYELRMFSDQALFTCSPAKNVLIKNIANGVI